MSEYYKRNLGFFSRAEQERIESSKVAIAGVGGDGFQLGLKMAMMGVEKFSIADPEVFEAENSNRVLGATALANGMNKAEIFRQRVLELRPEAQVDIYTDGVTEENVEAFMYGSNLVLDESELTYPHIGTIIAREARKQDVPVEIAMNIGFAGVVTSLKPSARFWTFERMMGLPKDMPLDEIKDLELDLGYALPYLPAYGDLDTLEAVQNGAPLPSITQGVDVASGIGSTEAFLHLIGGKKSGNHRREPIWNPRWAFYDSYSGEGGNRLHVGKSGYYKSIAKVAIHNMLNMSPKADYKK